jgi:hypothetical protein
MTIRKEMSRTNSLTIFASIMLGIFFIFNTTTMINVSAVEDNELSYYPPESPEYPPMNDYYSSEYNPDTYDRYYEDRYYDNYESKYYEDRYGKPYYKE